MIKRKIKEKIPEIKESIGVSKKFLLFLWKDDKKYFFGMLFALTIPTINPFINAYIYKLVIDLIVESFNASFNYDLFFILLAARLLTLLVQYGAFSLQGYMDVVLWTKIPVYLYKMILTKLTELDVAYFENPKFKDTLQRVREGYTWRPLQLYSSIFYAFQSVLQLTIAFFVLATLNWALSIAIVLASLPAFFNQLYFSKTIWGVWSEHSPYRKRFWYLSDLVQDRQGIKEMRVFRTAKKFISDIDRMQKRFARDNLAVGRKRLRNSLILSLLGTGIYLTLEAIVVLITVAGRISLGSLSYFTFAIFNFENGVNGLFNNINQVFNHSLYVKDIIKVLEMPSFITTPKKAIKIKLDGPPRIEFKDVSFSYPETNKMVLKNFNLTIEPGEKIAFVGENGAGKTTIIKLLSRFYDVSDGKILINGHNLKKLDLSSWHKMLGVIFQDFLKYEYTLGENIHFGKIYEKYNLGKIRQAAKRGGVDKIAEGFRKEYGQMLGLTFETGQELSLGQWQKVALARAFFRDAPILILDEPTSSIDAKAEKEIFDKVERLGKNKTVIIISHRFSTVRNADKIYVLKKGKIIEGGSHNQLLKKGGEYKKLFKLQADKYL